MYYIASMITKTFTGVVLPLMGITRLPSYNMQPNAYFRDLQDMTLQSAHANALVQRSKEKNADGAEFVDKAKAVATWHEYPRAHKVDVWA